jgi:hypothetical protein
MSGFGVGDDLVRWLWIVPITERARLTAKEYGSAQLMRDLAAEGRSWVVSL